MISPTRQAVSAEPDLNRCEGPVRKHLEIEQDLPFQYRNWRIERISWIIIALIIVAACFGAFGHHTLVRVKGQTPSGQLSIEYDRFARYESNTEISIFVETNDASQKLFRLWMDDGYFNALRVVDIMPLPVRGEASEGRRAFVFQVDGGRFTARLLVQFQSIGIITGIISGNDGEQISLKHMVWP
jgi:hypothetical protein